MSRYVSEEIANTVLAAEMNKQSQNNSKNVLSIPWVHSKTYWPARPLPLFFVACGFRLAKTLRVSSGWLCRVNVRLASLPLAAGSVAGGTASRKKGKEEQPVMMGGLDPNGMMWKTTKKLITQPSQSVRSKNLERRSGTVFQMTLKYTCSINNNPHTKHPRVYT